MSGLVSRAVNEECGQLQWDVYSQAASDTEIHLRDNKVESIRSPILSQGYAIRVIRDRGKGPDGEPISGVGIASGDLLKDESDVKRTLALAAGASKITSTPSYQLPSERRSLPAVKIVDEKNSSDQFSAARDIAEKVVSLLGAEAGVHATFAKIRLTKIDTALENCFGLSLQKSETFAYFEAGLSPTNGTVLAEYWPSALARRLEDLELEKKIPRWAGFARDSAKAKTPGTGDYSVIVPPRVLSDMAPPIVSFHASASSLKRGMSRWTKRREKVWSDKITISDDGLVDYAIATSPFDDEGTPQQRTEIIRKGQFQNYIANNMYARFASTKSTGNGVKRRRFQGVLCYPDDVQIGQTNIVMEGGDSSLDEMIKETKLGILMEQFSWMTPDPITGTFGAEIRHAYLVRDGIVGSPIKGGVVNGSFFSGGDGSEKGVFDSPDLISKETLNENASVLPYVRFPELRISGL